MATHSSVLAWRIPGTGEPGGLLSMGSHRVGHDWSDLAAAACMGWESWTIKKPEGWRLDALEIWCWRRLLRILRTARRSNQSIQKEANPEYSLERLKLKLQYFGYLMQRANSLEKTLMLGKIEGRKRRGWHRMGWLDWHHWLNGHEFEQIQRVSEVQESLAYCSPWGHSQTQLGNWTTTNAAE